MPRKTKYNDMLAQGEVSRCHAATIAEFLEEKGDDRIRSIGQLTRLTYETLAILLVKYADAREVTDTAEATVILKKMSYGTAFLDSDKYASAALKNMNVEAEADTLEFDHLPQPRGRKPQWTPADDDRMKQAAEKAISSPRIAELLKQLNGSANQEKENNS